MEKLYTQVTIPKNIDVEYARELASDLAYIVLHHEFDKRKWFVEEFQLNDHPLKDHVLNQTWPTPVQIQDTGDIWAHLPILPCYEIFLTIHRSVLYADWSHSMDKPQVETKIRERRPGPAPSKKVVQRALRTPQRHVRSFLKSVDEHGLPDHSLAIGLKGKEREIKKVGRFFSPMSWDLREYFVITEYLIKTSYVPVSRPHHGG